MRIKRFFMMFLLALLIFCQIPFISQAAPPLLNYQGSLTDDQGSPTTGIVSMIFRIYAAIDATPTQALWDSGTVSVPVVNGAFSIDLGDTSSNPPQPSLPANIFADDTRYLGVTVNGQELVPRKRLTSVPYALNAAAGIPRGLISMWSGSADSIPQGWALCDGVERALPDGSKITPPNLMDRFVVGAGAGYGVHATGGEAAHSLTINEMPNHTHIQNAHNHTLVQRGKNA